MKFKAIIFDMDGTIIDTTDIWSNATMHLIKNHGIDYTEDLAKEIHDLTHGLAIDKTCQIIKDVAKIDTPLELLISKKNQIAVDLYKEGIKFILGFEEFHKTIFDKNIKSAVATNADDRTLQITKDVLNIERFFGEHIYNISHVNNLCKPNPALYLHAAYKLNTDPKDCIAIEDSAHGIKAAKNAGIYCIGINTSGNLDQLKEADIIIDGYHQIDLYNIKK